MSFFDVFFELRDVRGVVERFGPSFGAGQVDG